LFSSRFGLYGNEGHKSVKYLDFYEVPERFVYKTVESNPEDKDNSRPVQVAVKDGGTKRVFISKFTPEKVYMILSNHQITCNIF
jgi:hypothetical protein